VEVEGALVALLDFKSKEPNRAIPHQFQQLKYQLLRKGNLEQLGFIWSSFG
jgi:hypothetical protein